MAKRSKRNKSEGEKIFAGSAHAEANAAWLQGDWLWGLVLIAAVFVAYSPVWWAGYIWDDDLHLTANPCIVGPLGLKEIWTTQAASICPLTLTLFWAEHWLWGLAPMPYHLVNVLFHAANATLLWRVLRELEIPGAWLGAALWALHPVQVESAAWISETKNTQSCLFYLLAILFFLKWLEAQKDRDEDAGDWNYVWTLLFAALAMASKFSMAVLPMVLMLAAWWREGRWRWRHSLRLLPIFAMSVIAGLAALMHHSLKTDPMGGIDLSRSWLERLATAGDAVWFYLGKLVWPYPLIFIYPRWNIHVDDWVSYLPLVAVIVVAVIFWRGRDSWLRPCFFALAYFLIALSPFLTLIDQSFWRYSFVEDHLQYVAAMGPLSLVAAGLVRWGNSVIPVESQLMRLLAGMLLSVLGIWSWQRAWIYQNQDTLWADTLAKNPNCWAAYNNLGEVLSQKGQIDEAIAEYKKALAINPNLDEVLYNLGIALTQKGQLYEAMTQYQKAIKIEPNFALAHINLGDIFAQKGLLEDAIAQYSMVLEIDPNYAEAYNNLGAILAQKGLPDQAVVQFKKALLLKPDFKGAQRNLELMQAELQHREGAK